MLKVFYCTDHDTLYSVGGASVVVAESEEDATLLLDKQLKASGLCPSSEKPYKLYELSLSRARAVILHIGDY